MKYLPACSNFSDALIIRCTTDLMISFLGGKIEMLPLFYVLIICKKISKFRNVKI